ncbi:unnamed protein product, partial [Closterium sp. Naga37s-1]
IISDVKLNGPIPDSISNLQSLASLYLWNTSLTGPIPTTIGNLPKLTDLELCYNSLSGTIPASIGNLISLDYLWLLENNLTGSIPATLSNLVLLTNLNLGYNDLTGTIPGFLGNLPKLSRLYLHMNNLTGSIPASLGKLSNLVDLVHLPNNSAQHNGPILLLFQHPHRTRSASLPVGRRSLCGSHCRHCCGCCDASDHWRAAAVVVEGPGSQHVGCSLRRVQQMADKNHPNIVRLLGFAIGGDMRTRPEQILIYDFGVLMLVVLTGRSPHTGDGERNGHILRWAEDCISSKKTDLLKDVSMDAPDDAVLRLAQLALRCTVQCTASRPSMADVANDLQGIRHEVVGKEELSAAVRVDAQAEGMRSGTSYPNNLAAMLQAIKGMEEDK